MRLYCCFNSILHLPKYCSLFKFFRLTVNSITLFTTPVNVTPFLISRISFPSVGNYRTGISIKLWGRGGLMVSALGSGASAPGSSPGLGHCVVFLGKTLYSHGASLHPGVQMGTGEFDAGGNPAMD